MGRTIVSYSDGIVYFPFFFGFAADFFAAVFLDDAFAASFFAGLAAFFFAGAFSAFFGAAFFAAVFFFAGAAAAVSRFGAFTRGAGSVSATGSSVCPIALPSITTISDQRMW